MTDTKNQRYSDPAFIEIVCRNLPPPECSGPRTVVGKQRVRYNALRHGLNVDDILPCKGDACYYAPLCPLLDQVEELPPLCAVEMSEYQHMNVELWGEADFDVHGYIILALRAERLTKCRAINPELAFVDNFDYHQTRLLNRLLKQQAVLRGTEGE